MNLEELMSAALDRSVPHNGTLWSNEHLDHYSHELALLVVKECFKVLSCEWYKRNEVNRSYQDQLLPRDQVRFNSGLLAGINIACHLVSVLEQKLKENHEPTTRQPTV